MCSSVRPELSVVIPVFNEAPNLEPLHREFRQTLDAWGRPYEVIFVDDGSSDGSFEILERLHRADPSVQVIQFRRNFGQTAAFAAGFAAARGRVIVTSDGDLQNDARDVPRLVDRLAEGVDIVCGWRKQRQDAWLSRRLPSFVANRLISWATGVRLNDYGCSLKVFRAEVVKPLRLYGEMHRFLPALASEVGVRIVEEPVNHRPRRHGASKYGISRTVRVLLDLLTVKFLVSYSTRPLQVFGPPGMVLGTAGLLLCGYVAYMKYFYFGPHVDRTWLLLMGILLIFTGLQFVTTGLLAEMLARTYHESQGKPIYVIRQTLGEISQK
jgi:glycosyltransferase involved in cell wall biosynthesis